VWLHVHSPLHKGDKDRFDRIVRTVNSMVEGHNLVGHNTVGHNMVDHNTVVHSLVDQVFKWFCFFINKIVQKSEQA
jgi:hypothetical protein